LKGPAELGEHQVAKVDDKSKVGSTALFVEDEELLAAHTQPIEQGQNQLNHLCVILLKFVSLLFRNILIQLFVGPFLFFKLFLLEAFFAQEVVLPHSFEEFNEDIHASLERFDAGQFGDHRLGIKVFHPTPQILEVLLDFLAVNLA
jgi:hypothetical protein